jgi:hypothetical protein
MRRIRSIRDVPLFPVIPLVPIGLFLATLGLSIAAFVRVRRLEGRIPTPE